MRRAMIILGVLASSITATEAAAQVVLNPAQRETNVVAVSGGMDSAVTLGGAYGRQVSVPRLALPVTWIAHVQMPASPDLGDGQLGLGATTAFVTPRGWGVSPYLSLQVRQASGDLLVVDQAAITTAATAGMFRPRWSAALEVGWEKSFLTYARPTDDYRMYGYAEARSVLGWSGGGTLRAGLQSTVRLAGATDLTVRAGLQTSEQLHGVAGVPYYGVVGATQRF